MVRGLLVAALMIFTVIGSLVRVSALDDRSEQASERTFGLSPGGQLSIENYKGKIEVEAWDQNQARVVATKHIEGGTEAFRRRWLEAVQVRFDNAPDRLRVKVEYPDTQGWVDSSQDGVGSNGVDLIIQAPRAINLDIDGYKPDMKVRGTHGQLKIKSYKSDINIESVRGSVSIDSYKNNIRLHNIDAQGTLFIKTYKGEVEANLSGIGEGASIDTYRGQVTLTLPDQYGMTVEFAGSRQSKFESQLPFMSNGPISSARFQGTINGGGPRLRFETYRGTLALRRSSGA